MVTARIAGLCPGTSPPPVRIPIRPFLVLMRPLCRFLRRCKGKIDGSDSMCKRHRSEPAGSLLAVYRKPLTMHEAHCCSGGCVAFNCPVATALCAVCPAALNNPNAPQDRGYTRISVIPFLGSCFETRSSPESLSATHRAFAFYLGNPISSIPGFLINKQRAL